MKKKNLLVVFAFMLSFFPLTGLAQTDWDRDPRRATFERIAGRALAFERVVDSLPESVWAVIDDQQDLDMWTSEIVPFFGYEGITGPESDELTKDLLGGYIYPKSMSFEFFDERGSRGQHHILGMANCMSGQLWMNGRYANPVSSMYQSKSALAVLVHELAHIQGICFSQESETSAQLVTLEVLAAMALKGNEAAFASLMLELQGMHQDAALAIALRDDRIQDFEYIFGLDGSFGGNSRQQGAWEKTIRYWGEEPEELERILMEYNFLPVALITKEIPTNLCLYVNVRWNTEKQDIENIGYYIPDLNCINGVQLPINANVFTVPLFIDDLTYVMYNYQEMALDISLENWPMP